MDATSRAAMKSPWNIRNPASVKSPWNIRSPASMKNQCRSPAILPYHVKTNHVIAAGMHGVSVPAAANAAAARSGTAAVTMSTNAAIAVKFSGPLAKKIAIKNNTVPFTRSSFKVTPGISGGYSRHQQSGLRHFVEFFPHFYFQNLRFLRAFVRVMKDFLRKSSANLRNLNRRGYSRLFRLIRSVRSLLPLAALTSLTAHVADFGFPIGGPRPSDTSQRNMSTV